MVEITGGEIPDFCNDCIDEDPVLCAPLKAFTSWDSTAFWSDVSGDITGADYAVCKNGNSCTWTGHEDLLKKCQEHIAKSNIQKALTDICTDDRESFLKIQMKVAKEQYLDLILARYPWLADRPECVQGEIMNLKIWGAADLGWLKEYKEKSDEEILLKVREIISETPTTSGPPDLKRAWNEPEIALGILEGKLTRYDVEEWVRTGDFTILTDSGITLKED